MSNETLFDLGELIAALRAAETECDEPCPPSAATVAELSTRMEMAPQTVRAYLRAGLAAGRVKHVRVKRMRMNNVLAMIDAYQLVPEPEADDGGA